MPDLPVDPLEVIESALWNIGPCDTDNVHVEVWCINHQQKRCHAEAEAKAAHAALAALREQMEEQREWLTDYAKDNARLGAQAERQEAAQLTIRAEWLRHGLHDPRSLKADELRQMVVSFGVKMHTALSPPTTDERLTHDPCCSSHGEPMTCEKYRRTHFVEVGNCCAIWAARHQAAPPPTTDETEIDARNVHHPDTVAAFEKHVRPWHTKDETPEEPEPTGHDADLEDWYGGEA